MCGTRAAERTLDEQRKGAELTVGVSLCASRFDELDGPLRTWHAQAPATLDALPPLLHALLEGHAELAAEQLAHGLEAPLRLSRRSPLQVLAIPHPAGGDTRERRRAARAA